MFACVCLRLRAHFCVFFPCVCVPASVLSHSERFESHRTDAVEHKLCLARNDTLALTAAVNPMDADYDDSDDKDYKVYQYATQCVPSPISSPPRVYIECVFVCILKTDKCQLVRLL